VDLYNRVASSEARQERLESELFELNQWKERFMADYQQAAADAEQAMTVEQGQVQTLAAQVKTLQDQIAASAAAGTPVDPKVQAAADALEAQAQTILSAATPATPAPPATEPGTTTTTGDGTTAPGATDPGASVAGTGGSAGATPPATPGA